MATARPRPQVMRLSEAAATRIKELMAKSDRPIAGLRVGVKNGGCAGMEYTMEYVDSIGPTDEVVEDKGVKLLIDPKAVLFLIGTEMDWKVGKLSSQFVFNNPNQTSACGCGESVLLTPAKSEGAFRRRQGALNGVGAVSGADPELSFRAVFRLRTGHRAPHVQRRGRLCRRPDDRAGGRRRDLSQSRRGHHPAVRSARGSSPFSYKTQGRPPHASCRTGGCPSGSTTIRTSLRNGRGGRWRRRGARTRQSGAAGRQKPRPIGTGRK